MTGATAAALSAMKVMAEAGRGRDSALALDQEPDQAASFHPRSGGVSLFSGALVIGGGIAGITAALAVADQGFDVDLVEQTGELGGNLVWLTSGIQGAADFLEQQVAAVWTHDRIRVHTRTRAAETTGRPGRWVTRLIPVRDTDRNMGGDTDAKTREQADVPLSGEKAGKASPGESVNQSQDILVRHGVVVLAVGGTEAGPDTVDPDPETGLYTQQQFQQALDGNEIDAGAPLQVAMFQCHGSRETGREYCSRVCCQRSLDQAMQLKALNPDTRVMIFYRDMMTPGLTEASYTEARKNGVGFVPCDLGNAPNLTLDDTGCKVTWTDPILGRDMEMAADCVVLAKGIRSCLSEDLARMFGAGLDRFGFLTRPISSGGLWRPWTPGSWPAAPAWNREAYFWHWHRPGPPRPKRSRFWDGRSFFRGATRPGSGRRSAACVRSVLMRARSTPGSSIRKPAL